MGEQLTGVYIPTEEEAYNCIIGHSSCEYGICSECSIGIKYSGEDVEEEDVEENEADE